MLPETSHTISVSTCEATLLHFLSCSCKRHIPNTSWPYPHITFNIHRQSWQLLISMHIINYHLLRLQNLHWNLNWNSSVARRSNLSLIVLKGKVWFTTDLPIKRHCAIYLTDYCRGIHLVAFHRETRAEGTLAEWCLPNGKTNFPTCCCSHSVHIRSGPHRGRALMFWVCVNTTREGQRVHMAPTIEHQFHWNTVV